MPTADKMLALKQARHDQQTETEDEERELMRLRFKLSARFGARPRMIHHEVQYMTRAEIEECLQYAEENNLAAIREVLAEVREREYPARAAEDIKRIGQWRS